MNGLFDSKAVGYALRLVMPVKKRDSRHFTVERNPRAASGDANREANEEERSPTTKQWGALNMLACANVSAL